MKIANSYPDVQDPKARQALQRIVSTLLASFGTQHNVSNDTHATITATGAITERGRSAAMGTWTPVAFAAGNYTATGTTWTVTAAQQVTLKYMLIGTTLFVTFYINGSSVGAGTANLYITIPINASSTVTAYGTCSYNDNGTKGTGVILAATGTTSPQLTLTKDIAASSNWTNVSQINVAGQIAFEISGSV